MGGECAKTGRAQRHSSGGRHRPSLRPRPGRCVQAGCCTVCYLEAVTVRALLLAAIFAGSSGCTKRLVDDGDKAPIGGPCAQGSDCESALCLTSDAEPTCGTPCDNGPDCEDDFSCMGAVALDGRGEVAATACLPSLDGVGFGAACAEDADCQAGLCLDDRCSEVCVDNCGPRGVCEQAELQVDGMDLDTGACRVDLGRPDRTFGPFEVDLQGAPHVQIEIAEGVTSFTLVAIRDVSHGPEWVGIRTLTAPDGTLLFNRTVDDPQINPAANNYLGASSILVPSTDHPDYEVIPGTYVATTGVWNLDRTAEEPFTAVAGTVDRVEVHLRHGAQVQLFDLNLHFAPETGLTAATAADDDFVVDMLAELDAVYTDTMDVRLGELQLFDLPDGLGDVQNSDEIRDLCAAYSQPGPNRISINAFVVDSIDFASGFTSGSPAPPGLYGTPASGLVIELDNTGTHTGTLLAHEVGHFLGLHHTTSMTLVSNFATDVEPDAIGDTDECANNTYYTGCPDSANLMFPFYQRGTRQLTFGQVKVLDGSPSLYAPFE